MNNINLNITVSDNSNLFKILNNIYDKIIDINYNPIIYKKHSGLINGCSKCWLNSTIQMIGYMDDIVDQIINMNPSGDPIKENIKNLFTDLINGGKPINYGTSFVDTENHGYGNLYRFFTNILMGKEQSGSFEDTSEGLGALFNYLSETLNLYNTRCTEIRIIKCKYNDYMNKIQTQYFMYMLSIPTTTPTTPTKPILLSDYLTTQFPKDSEETNLSDCNETKDSTNKYGPYDKHINIITNKYFIIQLILFSVKYDKSSNQYVSNKISPNLNISKKIKLNNCVYYLSGFIVHLGTTIHGNHYLFYKVLPNGSGILYDDSEVTDISTADIDRILTQNVIRETPYILLYEKREFTGNICKINYNVSHYDLTNVNTFNGKKDIINDKFHCYSLGILTNQIYDNFTFNQFVFVDNILYYKINITEQNNLNLNLLSVTVCKHLFNSNTDYNIIIRKEQDYILIKILKFNILSQPEQNLILAISNSLFPPITQLESEKINNFKFLVL